MGPLMSNYTVKLSPSAQANFQAITSKNIGRKVLTRMGALRTFPLMGSVYDPAYTSSMPPHQVRATYVEHYGIYYTVDETKALVNVEYIEDSHRNPYNKFRYTEIPASEA